MQTGIRPDWSELHRLIRLYGGDGRHYHTLRHVADCLRFMKKTFGTEGRQSEAILAIIYHDCIYDVRSKDNEERSADEFSGYATNRFSAEFVAKVRDLILATKNHMPVEDRMTQIVLDSDLHILAADWRAYKKYATNVWREYSVFGREGYVRGRRAFLETARREIEFSSPEMARKSSVMRRNLAMELAYLDFSVYEIIR